MLKSKNRNDNFIIIVILFLSLIILSIIFINNLKNKSNETDSIDHNAIVSNAIYCKTETSPTDKIEIYYDFKDDSVYRYTIVTTSPIQEDFDKVKKEKLINSIETLNSKYKGLISKIWFEDDAYTITEIFDLERLTESEMKNLTGISIKEIKNQSRDELKKAIIPMSSSSFYCK